jgi:hypothetical protein
LDADPSIVSDGGKYDCSEDEDAEKNDQEVGS